MSAEPMYASPEFDPADYDTVDKVAKLAAPLFAAHGWTYGSEARVPAAADLAATIGRLYENHREKALEYVGSGRLMLRDENPHNGHPVLYDGIQVYIHVGELPPIRGDEIQHGELFDLGDHIAAALDLAEKLDREAQSIDTTSLLAHLHVISQDYVEPTS